MQCLSLGKIFIRSVMVIFWIGILGLFLGLSHVMQLLRAEKSINIFSWPMLLDVAYLEQFEQETGIKINVSYFETNEELFSKLRATKGIGYDLIIPSDYVVQLIIDEGLLQKIDRTKISCWADLDPKLLNLYFDPKNEYTAPYFWAVFGLGIDKTYFKEQMPDASWALIFDKTKAPASIGMVDEAREAVLLATLYLFGTTDIAMTPEQIKAIKNLLLDQKAWVGAYTDSSIEHLLLSKNCPVVVAMGPDILKIKLSHNDIDFIVPKEGSFIVIDSFAIPAKSSKSDLVYQFINYLYKQEVLEHHRRRYGMCSPIKKMQAQEDEIFCPNDEKFAKMIFFKTTMPEALLNEIWIDLMAH